MMVDSEFTEAVEVEEPLSPRAMLFQQPSMNCHIIQVLGMGKKIDVEEFKAGLESTFVQHPRFSSILVSNGCTDKKPIWVRTKVVTENHMVVPDMSSVDTTITADEVVEDYLSFLSTTSMDFSRPLWDFHLLNIRTSDAEAVAVLRFHHSLGDAISLMSILLASTRKISDPSSVPTVPLVSHQTPKMHHSLVTFLRQFWATLVLLWHTLIDVMFLLATTAFLRDTKTLLKGTNGEDFRGKRFIRRTVRLDDVKTIKKYMGGTKNDVLVGVTSAALSRYLSRSFGEDHDMEKKGLPANILIRATLMVNIRQPTGIPALTLHFQSYVNKLTMVAAVDYLSIPDPHQLMDDLVESLKLIKDAANAKQSEI